MVDGPVDPVTGTSLGVNPTYATPLQSRFADALVPSDGRAYDNANFNQIAAVFGQAQANNSAPTFDRDTPLFANLDNVFVTLPTVTVRADRSNVDDFQAENDAKVSIGSYDRFKEIGNALAAGEFGNAWSHVTFEASPDARVANNERLFPTPSPAAGALNNTLAGPLPAIATAVTYMAGGSHQDAYYASSAAGALGGAVTALAGFQMPKAPLPGTVASKIRGRSIDGNAGILANKAAGDAWEAEVLKDVLPKTQVNIQPQITVRSNGPSGLRVRLDALGERVESGQVAMSDMKASDTAPLTKHQKVVYPELETYGGTVVGKGKFPYVGGTQLPPGSVDIIRKPKQ
jgi:hypothetical protein